MSKKLQRMTHAIRTESITRLAAGALIFSLAAGQALADCSIPGDPKAGEAVYNGTCVACHGKDGRGILPGIPDLSETNGRLAKPDEDLIANITEGFESGTAPMAMPAKGGNPSLSDEDIVNVLGYMRKEFGC